MVRCFLALERQPCTGTSLSVLGSDMLRKADDFDPKRFRASQIPPSNRLDAWRQVLNTWLLSADIRPITGRPFHGTACLRVSPEVRFGWGTLDATLNIRTRQLTS